MLAQSKDDWNMTEIEQNVLKENNVYDIPRFWSFVQRQTLATWAG